MNLCHWFPRFAMILALAGSCALPARAFFDESANPSANQPGIVKSSVQRLNADPSPNPVESNINNYINQDEQLNLSARDGVVKVLRTDQKIMLNDFETAVFPLHKVNPRDFRNIMRTVTGIEGGRAEVIRDKVTKENFIEVIAPRYMIPYLRDAIAELDQPWVKEYWAGQKDMYYKAQHRDAAAVDRIATTYGGDDGFSVIDTANNAVRRYDDDYRIEEYLMGAAIVDIPANQVLLDVNIYEINANNDTKLGLDYIAWKNGPGRNLFNFVFTAFDADQRAKGVSSVFDPFLDGRTPAGNSTKTILDSALASQYSSVNYLIAANYVDFLQSKGKARLVNSQQLLVASSRPATISAETQEVAIVNNENEIDTVVPDRPDVVITRNNNDNKLDPKVTAFVPPATATIPTDHAKGEAPDTVPVQDSKRRLHYRHAGIATTDLTVIPFVGLQSMELDIDLETGDVAGVAPNGLPILNTRTVKTTVRLLDGQPYVIAGVRQTVDSKNSAKAPILGSIPVLGWAFGGETNLKRETQLVIAITPHFILANQKSIAPSPELEVARAILDGTAPLPLPDNNAGYDQWLLGQGATRN